MAARGGERGLGQRPAEQQPTVVEVPVPAVSGKYPEPGSPADIYRTIGIHDMQGQYSVRVQRWGGIWKPEGEK